MTLASHHPESVAHHRVHMESEAIGLALPALALSHGLTTLLPLLLLSLQHDTGFYAQKGRNNNLSALVFWRLHGL